MYYILLCDSDDCDTMIIIIHCIGLARLRLVRVPNLDFGSIQVYNTVGEPD